MKKRISKKLTIILVVSVIPCLFLLTVVAPAAYDQLFAHRISDAELRATAITYAKRQCKADERNNKFCDDLHISSISDGGDFSAVWWTAYIARSDTGKLYSSFVIKSNGDNLKADERTYTLAQPGTRIQPVVN
jgi:hypothetical protein